MHADSLDVLDELSDADAGKLFRAIADWHRGLDPEIDGIVKIAFLPFRSQFIRDAEKYERIHAARVAAGSRGGRAAANARKTRQTPANLTDCSSKDASDQVHELFEYWRNAMKKNGSTKLTKTRAAKIRARLQEGYTADEIKLAINGCRASEYHQGKNDAGKIYDCLTLICRSGEKLEQFIGYTAAVNSDDRREQAFDSWIDGDGTDEPPYSGGEIIDSEVV